jgi:integrase
MLNTHISRYVSLHRSLGRKFSEQERLLRQYAAFAERFGDRHTQVQRIYDWCHTASSQMWLAIGSTPFATSAFSLMPRTQTTKSRLSASSAGEAATPTPTIIEPDQVRAIMAAALDVPPHGTISPYTYHYLFGLLAATGLRISEALALQCNDLVEDGLIVRNGKFGKQRLIALQPSTRQALEAYLARAQGTRAKGNDLFVTIRGGRRTRCAPTSCSSGWPGFSDIVDQPVRPGCGYTICGILSPCVRLSPARATGRPSPTTWPVSASIWGTRRSPTRIGISKPPGAAARHRCASEQLYRGEAA